MKIDPTITTNEQIEARINALPDELRARVFGDDLKKEVRDIIGEAGINPELAEKIVWQLNLIFLGMAHRKDFDLALHTSFGIGDEQADRASALIYERIIDPLTLVLAKAFDDSAASHEPTLQTAEESPEEHLMIVPSHEELLNAIENPMEHAVPSLVPRPTPAIPRPAPAVPKPIYQSAAAPITPRPSAVAAPAEQPAASSFGGIRTMQGDLASPGIAAEKLRSIVSMKKEQRVEEKITTIQSTQTQGDPYREAY